MWWVSAWAHASGRDHALVKAKVKAGFGALKLQLTYSFLKYLYTAKAKPPVFHKVSLFVFSVEFVVFLNRWWAWVWLTWATTFMPELNYYGCLRWSAGISLEVEDGQLVAAQSLPVNNFVFRGGNFPKYLSDLGSKISVSVVSRP